MGNRYEINNLTAIKGGYKHRADAPPPTVVAVLTTAFSNFKAFVASVRSKKPEGTYYKENNACDIIVGTDRFIMCSSVRTVRGLEKYKLFELADATQVSDYYIIQDHYKFNRKLD